MDDFIGNLSFAYPQYLWALFLTTLSVAIVAYRYKHNKLSTVLRIVLLTILVFVAAKPQVIKTSTAAEINILFDVSSSITDRGRETMSALLRTYINSYPQIKFYLAPFAQDTSTAKLVAAESTKDDLAKTLNTAQTQLDTTGTNIAGALATLNNSLVNRPTLLFSDGQANTGDTLKQARLLKNNNIKVYPIIPAADNFIVKGVSIAALQVPAVASTAADIEIRIALKNTSEETEDTRLEIFIDEEKINELPTSLAAGKEKLLTAKLPKISGGLHKIRAVLLKHDQHSAIPREEKHAWISIKEQDKILLIGDKFEEIELLEKILALKGFTITTIARSRGDKFVTDFKPYSTIVLNNIARRQLPANFLDQLKTFVNSGGALVNLGGDQSFGLGDYIDSPLEEISPIKFTPPQTTKKQLNNAVVLLIDKSRSMFEENKMTAAKSAALSSIQTLKDNDLVGVTGFDSAPFVIIRLGSVAEVKTNAEHRLRNLTAAGQTNPLPALAAARQSLASADAGRKHIIMLSDGKFPIAGGEYEQELDRISAANITLSTIALGYEADVPLLKMFASYCNGAFYQTVDSSTLPEIFIRDIKVTTGEKTMHEQDSFPVSIGRDGLRSTLAESIPSLNGFVETTIKPGAQLELVINKKEISFPLLASWNYGQGTVISFTSDLSGRWSLPWLKWRQMVDFWTTLFTQLKNKNENDKTNLDFDLRYTLEDRAIKLDLAIFDPILERQAAPKTKVAYVSPDGSSDQTEFLPLKKGRFQTIINAAQVGDYKLNISYGQLSFPPLAITIPANAYGERVGQGIDVKTLSDIAFLTDGKINPALDELSSAAATTTEKIPLHRPLLLLAMLLILLEAFYREGSLQTIGKIFGNTFAKFIPRKHPLRIKRKR